MKYYLAIDLGASSGRHIVGHLEDGKIVLDEVYRFKNGMIDSKDGLVWDIRSLFKQIKRGIRFAFKKYPKIESLSIDTWGVDYVLMNGNKEIPPFYAYRNERCEISANRVHEIIDFKEIYARTGIQFAAFNTLYQLYDDLLKERLDSATDYLMLPSYFTYKLTGVKTHEYTNESTGSLLNAKTGEYDRELIEKLNLPAHLFININKPGEFVGYLTKEIEKEVGGNCKVVLCASHDTGSAFEAVDVDEDTVILSSGTWSLIGIKTKKPIISEASLKANYTNEGGVSYIRFLKNVMGMWISNQLKNEVCYTQEYIDQNIYTSTYKITFDVNDQSLIAPKNMKLALLNLFDRCPPQNNIELFASIYRSMAYGYSKAIDELEEITNRKFNKILIVGGGAKNKFLNEQVEYYTKRQVIALPIEATAMGNLKIQMKASKEL